MAASFAAGDPNRSRLLRAALAMPLLYVLVRSLPRHWSWVFPSAQATDFYAVNGLLFFIPIAVWGLALVLLAVGSRSRIAWAVALVASALVATYGLLGELSIRALDPGLLAQLRIHELNPYVAFGVYVVLLGAWQLSERSGRRRPGPNAQG